MTILAIVVILALWQRAHPFSIQTSTDIDASPSAVWSVLVDIDAYPEWSPLAVEGEFAEGATIVVADGTARVVDRVDNERLSWQTTTAMVGVFDGDRSFVLEPIAGGGTRFTQSEEFRGITVPFVSSNLRDDTAPGFHELNAALRERVEGL